MQKATELSSQKEFFKVWISYVLFKFEKRFEKSVQTHTYCCFLILSIVLSYCLYLCTYCNLSPKTKTLSRSTKKTFFIFIFL